MRAEWSDEATSRVKLPPDVYLLQEALEDELPELRYGTAAAQILGRMQDRKEVAVVKLQEGYLIIFPERMVSPFTGMTMTFQCEDQFAISMTERERERERERVLRTACCVSTSARVCKSAHVCVYVCVSSYLHHISVRG